MRRRSTVVAGCALLAVGASLAPPAFAAQAPPAGVSTGTIEHQGVARSYRLYVPSSPAPPRERALIVVLHGGFGNGAIAARTGRWDAAAERHGYVAVYPEGLTRSWNAGGCCGPAMRNDVDDVGFVVALTEQLVDELDVDPDRVFVTGISNGGMMSYRLACEASDTFAAAAPVAATLVVDGCRPSQPVSLLHIHGLADRNVPFDGGFPTRSAQADPPDYAPVRDGVDVFLRADACGAKAKSQHDGPVVTERWSRCDAGTAVELVTIAGIGHAWPGGLQPRAEADPPGDALDATEVVWEFFADHPRER
jgi:polyhydroxybutyrate depolymerase